MLEENKQIVRKLFEEYWNKGKLDGIEQIVSSDCRLHDPVFPSLGTGVESLAEAYTDESSGISRPAFQNRRYDRRERRSCGSLDRTRNPRGPIPGSRADETDWIGFGHVHLPDQERQDCRRVDRLERYDPARTAGHRCEPETLACCALMPGALPRFKEAATSCGLRGGSGVTSGTPVRNHRAVAASNEVENRNPLRTGGSKGE